MNTSLFSNMFKGLFGEQITPTSSQFVPITASDATPAGISSMDNLASLLDGMQQFQGKRVSLISGNSITTTLTRKKPSEPGVWKVYVFKFTEGIPHNIIGEYIVGCPNESFITTSKIALRQADADITNFTFTKANATDMNATLTVNFATDNLHMLIIEELSVLS